MQVLKRMYLWGRCLAIAGSLALPPLAGVPIQAAAVTDGHDRGQHNDRDNRDDHKPGPFHDRDDHKPSHITIVTQPVSQTVVLGQRTTLTVAATGKPRRLQYQWRKDGHRVGWDSPSLTIPMALPWSAGTYTVTVSNPTGHVTSEAAVLTVNLPPRIRTQPVGRTVVLGGAAQFSVTAEGSGSLSYQWRKEGVAITGATASTFALAQVAAADASRYDVVVTNTLNGTTTTTHSRPAWLQVNLPPSISLQPSSLTLVQGSSVLFKVAASVQPWGVLGYQWRKDGVNLAGATSASYAVASVSGADAGTYDAVLTNTLRGTVTTTLSMPAVLAVNLPPVITGQPVAQTLDQGAGVTFTVVAKVDGGGTLAYQWRKDGVALPGANQAAFTLPSVSALDAGSYDVLVSSNLNGTTTTTPSLPAVLKVNIPPTITVQPQTQTTLPPDPITFTVTATANNGGTLTYLWKKNGTVIDGATSASYTVASTEFATNTDAYDVVVSEANLSTGSATVYAIASVPSQTYAGDPVPVPSRPLTVLSSLHVDAVNFPNGAFRLGYDEALKNPVWTAYVNFPVKFPYKNSNADYKTDSRLAAPQVGKNDYTGIYTGGASYADSYDRGHQVPRADVSYRYTTVAGDDATIMSNLVPQISQFNQQTWQKLEDAIGGTQGGDTDGLTSFKGRVWVYTGSVFPASSAWWNSTITPGLRIAIPVACYKIVVHEKTPGHPEVLAMLLPNTWGLVNSASTLTGYVSSVAHIEAITGLDFFPNLATVAPDLDIAAWKANVDVRGWRVPFEQPSGPNVHVIEPSYDTTVDLGTALTFNGVATPDAAAAAGTTIASATWNFGDTTPTATGFSANHLFTTTGTFQVAFTANDSLGSANTLTRVVRVIPPASSNTAPTTVPAVLAAVSTAAGQAATVTFSVADDRTPLNAIKVAATSDNALLLPDSAMVATNASGMVTLVLNPVGGQAGTATVTVVLTDSDGAITTGSFLMTVAAAASHDLLEGFEVGTKTGYGLGNVAFRGGTWALLDALVGTSATDRKNGAQCLRIRNGKATMLFDWPNGAQTVTLNHGSFGTDAASTWELWYSTDSGTTWTLAGPAVTTNAITLTQASFVLNVPGPIRFEVRKTDNKTTRFNMDDFQITGF